MEKTEILFYKDCSLCLGKVFLGPIKTIKDTTQDLQSYEFYRLKVGIPEGPLDLEAEKSIPLENGMDEVNAISWTKGCFLGQELTSRTKYVGEVRKKLLTFKGLEPVFRGDLLFDGDSQEVGRVMSVYGNGQEGFALVKASSLSVNDPLKTQAGKILIFDIQR